MAKGKKRSESAKVYYSAYNYEKQKKARLERHMARHPEDKQVEAALKNLKSEKNRSNNKGGWVDKNAWPWVELSTKPQRILPTQKDDNGPAITVNSFDLAMSMGVKEKKRFAQFASSVRHANKIISDKRLKEMHKEARLGYAAESN